jgi:hypothetical protein
VRCTPPAGLAAVGVIAGLVPPPYNSDDPFARLVEHDPAEAEVAAREHFTTMAGDVDASVRAMGGRDGPDSGAYSQSEIRAQMAETRREAFRRGVEGAVLDLTLPHQPWNFELRDLQIGVRWWHGSLDPVVPLDRVRAATAGTRIDLTVYEGEGHAIGFAHGGEIVESLIATL